MSRSALSEPRFPARRLRLGRRGTTALEWAFILNAFLALLLGGLEVGRYFFVAESVRHLVGEVARAAIITPSADFTKLKDTFVARAPILQSRELTLNVNVVPAKAPALTTVTVTANYNYDFKLAIISDLVNSISASTKLSFAANPGS